MSARRARAFRWGGAAAAVSAALIVTPAAYPHAPAAPPTARSAAAPLEARTQLLGAPSATAPNSTTARPETAPPPTSAPEPAPSRPQVEATDAAAPGPRQAASGPVSGLAAGGIPATALDAYTSAAADAPVACHLHWSLLAAI